jgi:hypothetical protein
MADNALLQPGGGVRRNVLLDAWDAGKAALAEAWHGPQSPITGGPMYDPRAVPAPTSGREGMQQVLAEYQDPAKRGVGVNTVLGFTESPAAVGKLPMDAASRAARAQAMGYTIDAYKGGPGAIGGPVTTWKGKVLEDRPWEPLTEFSRPAAPHVGGPFAGFFSDSPEIADRFAGLTPGAGSAVYPVKLQMKNPVVIDAQGKPAAAFQFDMIARQHGTAEDMARMRSAFAEGSPHDGVILQNTADEGTVYVPRTSPQVRSRFANFDPAKARSGDILAGTAAGGVGLNALLPGRDDQ